MLNTNWLPALISALTVAGMEAAQAAPKPPARVCSTDSCSAALGATQAKASSAARFVDSIGVNTHFSNWTTPYVNNFPMAKAKLLALGVRHIRDGAHDIRGGFASNDNAGLFRDLANSGIRTTFIFNANVSKELVQGFPARVAPGFEAYEFPNELNGTPDKLWAATLREWAPKFQSYIRSNPAVAGYPIIGPSLIDMGENPWTALGDLSPYMDYGNVHAYYSSRDPATVGWGARAVTPCDPWRYGAIGYKMCNSRRVSGQKRIVSTETGWGTDLKLKGQVPESIQAKYLVRALLLHFDAGVYRTFIYQLIDSGSDSFVAYGLVTATGAEKPSFIEISTLIKLLKDSLEVEQPDSMDMSIAGEVAAVRTMLFQMSDGSFRLILWTEKPGFDPVTAVPIGVPPSNIKLRLKSTATIKSISAFQDNGGVLTSVPPRADAGEYALAVTDNLMVAEIVDTQGD
jgi:hypothetical protein